MYANSMQASHWLVSPLTFACDLDGSASDNLEECIVSWLTVLARWLRSFLRELHLYPLWRWLAHRSELDWLGKRSK